MENFILFLLMIFNCSIIFTQTDQANLIFAKTDLAALLDKSRTEFPNLVGFYQKLKEKGFEIVIFDKDDKIDNLQKSFDQKGMNWIYSKLDDPLSQLYRIDRYPTYFLPAKEGKIISNTALPDEEFYKKIEGLLRSNTHNFFEIFEYEVILWSFVIINQIRHC